MNQDHKIKKKLKELFQLELSNPSITNSIKIESLERGTNPRPNAYEAFALPG